MNNLTDWYVWKWYRVYHMHFLLLVCWMWFIHKTGSSSSSSSITNRQLLDVIHAQYGIPCYVTGYLVPNISKQCSYGQTFKCLGHFNPWRRDHDAVPTHHRPIIQRHGIISQKKRYLSYIAAENLKTCKLLPLANLIVLVNKHSSSVPTLFY